jgi:hypothetical protein
MNTVRHTTLKVKFLLSPPRSPSCSLFNILLKNKNGARLLLDAYIYPLSISDLVFFYFLQWILTSATFVWFLPWVLILGF